MQTAVIYARYSSDSQTEQSIEGQLRVCHEYAKLHNILIVDTYIDRAMTGTNDNRASFQKMLKDSEKQAWDYVIVYKLDRFSRNKYESVIHKKTLRDNGVRLVSAMENLSDSPEGRMLETILEGFNQYFSEELSQKVIRGLNESRRKGQFTGGRIPYGYKVENKKVYIEPESASIVIYIFEQYAMGVYAKNIIQELNNKGILNRGKPFGKNAIYGILANEKYSGVVTYNNEKFTNIYPPIVPKRTFEIVKHKIEENKFGKHDTSIVYLLKNKIKCGYCGNAIISDSGTSRNGTVNRYYKCQGRKTGDKSCKKTIIRKEVLEKLIVNTTFKIFENNSHISYIVDKIYDINKKRMADQSILMLLTREKNDIQKGIENLLSLMEQGIVTNSTKKRIIELEKNLDEIEAKILKEKSQAKLQITKEDISKFLRTTLKKTPQQILKLLIDKVILFDNKVEIYYNYIDKKTMEPDDRKHQAFSILEDKFDTILYNTTLRGEPINLRLDIKAYISA